VVREIEASGGQAIAVSADVTREEDLRAVAASPIIAWNSLADNQGKCGRPIVR
jgi:hypothetical protein